MPPVRGVDGKEERAADPDAPFCGLAFKVTSDAYAGRLVYVRIYSGTLKAGGHAFNASTGKGLARHEALPNACQSAAQPWKRRRPATSWPSWDPRTSRPGDTLCDKSAPILLEKIEFPEPVVFAAVEPRTEAERGELMEGLAKLAQEDPTFHVRVDETTDQIVIGGMGELHLDVLVRRLREELRVHGERRHATSGVP